MPPINAMAVPKRKEVVEVAETAAGVAIHLPGDPAAFELNPSAYAIWNLCDGVTTVQEIAEAIAELTGSPLVPALQEVSQLILALRRADLLE